MTWHEIRHTYPADAPDSLGLLWTAIRKHLVIVTPKEMHFCRQIRHQTPAAGLHGKASYSDTARFSLPLPATERRLHSAETFIPCHPRTGSAGRGHLRLRARRCVCVCACAPACVREQVNALTVQIPTGTAHSFLTASTGTDTPTCPLVSVTTTTGCDAGILDMIIKTCYRNFNSWMLLI